MSTSYLRVRYNVHLDCAPDEMLDLEALAAATGVQSELISRLYCLGILEANEEREGAPWFAPTTIWRLKRVLRLRRDLGLGWNSLGVVCDLLEQIEALDVQVRHLERQLAQHGEFTAEETIEVSLAGSPEQ